MTEPKTLYQSAADVPAAVWRWPNFTPQEIACKGSGAVMIDPAALDMLQALRDAIAKPIVITSGYRSPDYNRKVGGVSKSRHLEGIAFDCVMSGHDPAEFQAAAKRVGFTAFGHYPKQNFMHIDCRPYRAEWTQPAGAKWAKTPTIGHNGAPPIDDMPPPTKASPFAKSCRPQMR